MDKIYKLIVRKYYWSMSYQDIDIHIKDCDIYLTLKTFVINHMMIFKLIQAPLIVIKIYQYIL